VLIEDYEEAVAEESAPRRPSWRKPVIAAGIAAAVLAGGITLLASSDPTRTVSGTPVASAAEVTQYTDEVKAQALADAAAYELAYLSSLESQVQTSMQEYFDDPATALFLPVYVGKVSLIRTSASTFEGTVTLRMQGYNPHQIAIHVTADGRNFMWKTDQGALVALLS
jgi:hypothetical protein